MLVVPCCLAMLVGCQPDESDIEDQKLSVEQRISNWAEQPQRGPQGRPLPLISSWDTWASGLEEVPLGNAARAWTPDYYVELIKAGNYVLPTFRDPHFLAMFDTYTKTGELRTDRLEELVERMRPALEFCREHRLPIAFVSNNFEDMVRGLAVHKVDWVGGEPNPETDPRLIFEGRLRGAVDPLGPEDGWRDFAELWFGHLAMKKFQEIYPDPPLVLFFSNNEGGKANITHFTKDNARFVEQFGDRELTDLEKRQILDEGYNRVYGALFEAARETLTAPGWKKAVRFVAYNLTSREISLGKGGYVWPEDGYPKQELWDGSIPEYYDNDWQPGKTDYMAESPQAEAMNLAAMQDAMWDANPDFFWGSIIWEGSTPGDFWRPRGSLAGVPAKTNLYAVGRAQTWDFHRWKGVQQFGLWTMRPRLMMEFRGGAYRNAWENSTFEKLLEAGKLPWTDPVLGKFWRHGRLLPNPNERPRHEFAVDQPEWVENLPRWFLLTCDANPPRFEPAAAATAEEVAAQPIPTDEVVAAVRLDKDLWKDNSIIRVFAIALELGEAPQREWLIYAHAPLGAVGDATVQVPGFGPVKLDVISPSGSFFLLSESTKKVVPHVRGTPVHHLAISPADARIRPGESVEFAVETAAPADDPLTQTVWTFGGDRGPEQSKPASTSHRFDQPGRYVITATATSRSGAEVVAQAFLVVGQEQEESFVVHLALDGALESGGPWASMGDDGMGIATYRHLPNAGAVISRTGQAQGAVVVEGDFVEDADRGRVLELTRDRFAEAGVYFFPNVFTTVKEDGYPERVISFSFKARDAGRRQVLYAEGGDQRGVNIYLDAGHLRAGAWDLADEGAKQNLWLDGGPVESDQWVDVTLVFDAAASDPSQRVRLLVDGKPVASGDLPLLKPSFAPPRLGVSGRLPSQSHVGIRPPPFTRFHDDAAKLETEFVGRLSNFQLQNSVPAAYKEKEQ